MLLVELYGIKHNSQKPAQECPGVAIEVHYTETGWVAGCSVSDLSESYSRTNKLFQ